MKILLLCEWLENIGGCENFAVQLYTALKKDFDITVYCCSSKIHQRWRKLLNKDLIVPEGNCEPHNHLIQTIENRHIDLIHAVPYEKTSFSLVEQGITIPTIGTEPSDGSSRCYWWYSGESLKNVVNKFDLIHVFSDHVKRNLKRDYNVYKTITTIPPLNNLENKVSWKRINPSNRLIYFGRISPEKGVDSLCHVLHILDKTHQDLTLDIWGGQKCDCAWVEKLTFSMGLRNKIFFKKEFQSLDEIPISDYDAYVFASHFEGCPYSVIEAMLTGIPCICTKRNGIGTLMSEVDSMLFVDDHIYEIAKGINTFYENFAYYRDLSEQRIDAALKIFNSDKIIKQYSDLYKSFQL